MSWHNSKTNYGIVGKSLHWVMALLIIGAWIAGYTVMELMPETSPNRGWLIELHKSVGMLILMLVVVRISWRIYDGIPLISTRNKVLVTAAKTVHYLLYVNIVVQCISGWAMSSAAGYFPSFFGLFTFPGLIAQNHNIVPELVGVHNASAMVLLTLVILHVGGALFHHFVLKDNTLRKMTVD